MTDKAMEKASVGVRLLSEALGISPRQIQRHIEGGVLVKDTRGKYPLVENVRRYIDFKQQESSGDEWRDARTENLRIKTQREGLALERDKLAMKAKQHDAALDPYFDSLLLKHYWWANGGAHEIEHMISQPHALSRVAMIANKLTDLLANSRKGVLDDLKSHRKMQLDSQLAEIDQILDDSTATD